KLLAADYGRTRSWVAVRKDPAAAVAARRAAAAIASVSEGEGEDDEPTGIEGREAQDSGAGRGVWRPGAGAPELLESDRPVGRPQPWDASSVRARRDQDRPNRPRMLLTLDPPTLRHDLSISLEDVSTMAVEGGFADPAKVFAAYGHLHPISPASSCESSFCSGLGAGPGRAHSRSGSARMSSVEQVELAEILGISHRDISSVLDQLQAEEDPEEDPDVGDTDYTDAADLPDVGDTDYKAAFGHAIAVPSPSPPALSSPLRGLRLEATFDPHSTDGDERLVIKGRKVEVFVKLLRTDGR
ncbi:hypothetical protein T492DRAFT_853924, partial [Pavlovales sp. CCMP2436]